MDSHATLYSQAYDMGTGTETTRPETPKNQTDAYIEPTVPMNFNKAPSPDSVKFTSPAPCTASSITPPPSSNFATARAVVRTPTSPTPQLTSPPLTSKLPDQPSVLTDSAAALFSDEQVDNASPEELRSMIHGLSDAFRDMRLSAAHYKLQYNMAVMESQESASRMAVELAMAQRDIDVLQQAEEKRRHNTVLSAQNYQESATAANAIIMSELGRQNELLQNEMEELRDLLDQQKRVTEHREGELASIMEENDRLKTRIRKNRDHIQPLLEQIEQSSPRSVFGTPHQATPRHRVTRVAPPMSTENSRGQNNFETLLLADKMLRQETGTAPTTPTRARAPRSRFSHQRGAQSMSSLPPSVPPTPDRRTHYAQVPHTPPVFVPSTIPQYAPAAHYLSKPSQKRRQSSNSTITASGIDEEEAFTDREGDNDGEDEVPESQASQMATTLLRKAAPPLNTRDPAPSSQANLVQSKIFGQVKKGPGPGPSRSGEFEKRRLQEGHQGSPNKRGRVDYVGLRIGGLLRD